MASSQGLVAECPTCKAVVPIDAPECPQCGELFETEASAGTTAPPPSASAEDSANDDEEIKEKTGFREKFLFYAGIFLILLGGPGIALGSWLHDELRISVGEFTAFDAFGPWNRLIHGFFARPRRGVPDMQGRRAHRCSRVPAMRGTVRSGSVGRDHRPAALRQRRGFGQR